MKLTEHRQAVLDHLTTAGGLLSASEIHAALPDMNLTTVYRALEYLVSVHAVKKLALGNDEAVFEVQHEPHHHAICDECGKVLHFTTNDPELRKEFKLPGFVIHDLEVILHGRCASHR